jgi:hypothetical protein
MTNPAFSLPPDQAVEALVNEVIDAESEGNDALALTLMRKGVAEYPGFGAKLAATRAAIKSLGQPVPGRDQRTEVLVEVDYVRPFLSPRVRKQISASRVAVAAGVVLTASLLTILQYMYPQLGAQGSSPAPIGELVDASQADAAASVRSLASTFADLRDSITEPVAVAMSRTRGPARSVQNSLSLGELGAYDIDNDARSSTKLATSLTLSDPIWVRSTPMPTLAPAAQPSVPMRLRLDDGPELLFGDGRNASVRSNNPLAQLTIDGDGVVRFRPDVKSEKAGTQHPTLR